MNELRKFLATIEPGKVVEDTGLAGLLAACWDELKGSGEGGMEADKLSDRMEHIHWNPPILEFVIERHGPTACGSTLATLQHWEVDLDNRTALFTRGRYRRVGRTATSVSREERVAIAKEIAVLVSDRKQDDRLVWAKNGTVQVMVERVFNSKSKQTAQGRSKRFRPILEAAITGIGWKPHGTNWFRRADP